MTYLPRKKSDQKQKILPSTSVEDQEERLIALANNLAEQKLRDGTASSQLISMYVKMGSTEERIKKRLVAEQVELAKAKTEAMLSAKRVEELYEKAINAMRGYAGNTDEEDVY